MTKIWEYGRAGSKVAVKGAEWHGYVIAVPKGMPLNVFYDITLADGRVVKAKAVDTTKDSFSMPEKGVLAKDIGTTAITNIKPSTPNVESTASKPALSHPVLKSLTETHIPTAAANYSDKKEDEALAQFFNSRGRKYGVGKPGDEKFHCQSCISSSPEQAGKMATLIAKEGNERQLAVLLAILPEKQVEIKQAYVTAKSPKGLAEASQVLQSSGMSESCPMPPPMASKPKRFQYDIVAGVFGIGSTSFNGAIPVGQVGAKYNLSDDVALNLGGSLRPKSTVRGQLGQSEANLLEANASKTFTGGKKLAVGVSTIVGNPIYQQNPFNNTTTLSCGCSGPVTDGKTVSLRDGLFAPKLNEYTIAGLHGEWAIKDKDHLHISAGVARSGDGFENRATVATGYTHKFNDKVSGVATAAWQPGQASANLGVVYNATAKTTISAAAMHSQGRENKTGGELRVTHQATDTIAASAAVVAEYDRNRKKSAYNFRVGGTWQPRTKIPGEPSINPVLILGKEGKETNIGGGVGVTFKF